MRRYLQADVFGLQGLHTPRTDLYHQLRQLYVFELAYAH